MKKPKKKLVTCRICFRYRPVRFMQRDIYGDEWECRGVKGCEAECYANQADRASR